MNVTRWKSCSLSHRRDQVRSVWKGWRGNRPAPVLLVISYDTPSGLKAVACGATGEDPSPWDGLDVRQIERLARTALAEPDRDLAARLVQQSLPEAQTQLPGVRNAGLFSTHELLRGVPNRPDWGENLTKAGQILALRGEDLVKALGFTVERTSTASVVLRADGTRRAVAVFLDEGELPETSAPRFNGQSPVTYALATADVENLPYAVVTRGTQIRLYLTRPDAGVGRKGRTETFFELNLALVTDETAGYLNLIFGPDALSEGGTLEQIMADSSRYAADIGTRLRERVYHEAIPALATAIARHESATERGDRRPTETELSFYYEQAMLVLFRILFVAYAEDRDLLPYRTNGEYQHHSLKSMAERLADRAASGDEPAVVFDADSDSMWIDVNALWHAVADGNRDWGVPAYDGGLFDDDPVKRPAAAALAQVSLTNAEFGPALHAMLVDQTPEGHGPVDFRSLSVREFGTIYEGLLESSLGFAAEDLAVDRAGSYLPAGQGAEVAVQAGEYYLHNRSGARKSSGSYFTKPFAVEHLLDHALEPALDDHLNRIAGLLDNGDEAGAAEQFFAFRCADIAMGSGHFLVAVVDRIERRFANFLAERSIVGITLELQHLRNAAMDALGPLATTHEIEDSSLLRRQIARRCIYGVDRNAVAVDLARLSVWIHTFVPGLPLSLLDRTLICGDSLTGMGTIEELASVFVPISDSGVDTADWVWQQVEEQLQTAVEPLTRLAAISEATIAQVKEAAVEYETAADRAAPVGRLMDLGVAIRNGRAPLPAAVRLDALEREPGYDQAQQIHEELRPVHFPAQFPEVFMGDRPGFDCIVGNPPWDKLMQKEDSFWAIRFPGLKSKSVSEMNREIARLRKDRPDVAIEETSVNIEIKRLNDAITAGPYPEIGSGHVDLYKAFCWRFWQLVASDSHIGVVLPRSALASLGTTAWRMVVLKEGVVSDATLLVNNRQWVFDDVHPQFTIALTTVGKTNEPDRTVVNRGPYNAMSAYREGMSKPPLRIPATSYLRWTDTATFPMLGDAVQAKVFDKIKSSRRLDDHELAFRFRPVQGDFNSTIGKQHFILDLNDSPLKPSQLWPVYGGKSFDLWKADSGKYYAHADSNYIADVLFEKRKTAWGNSRSAFGELSRDVVEDPDTLECMKPRLAYRKITRATDTRTLRVCLIPPRVVTTTSCPYLLRIRGNERDEAFLLGLMSSILMDWCARRFVEMNLDFYILNALPIPDTPQSGEVRRLIEVSAGRLAAADSRYEEWAAAVDVPVESVKSETQRVNMMVGIDACVATLFGLDEDDIRTIYETFHVGWNYQERLDAVLEQFRTL